MILSELEDKVVNKIEREMLNADSRDTISKLYRQARLWVRFHWYYEEQCGAEHALHINLELKRIYCYAKRKLEERQCKN